MYLYTKPVNLYLYTNLVLAVEQLRLTPFVLLQEAADSQHIVVAAVLSSGMSQPPTVDTGLLEGPGGDLPLKGDSTNEAATSVAPGECCRLSGFLPAPFAHRLQQEMACLHPRRHAAHWEHQLLCVAGG